MTQNTNTSNRAGRPVEAQTDPFKPAVEDADEWRMRMLRALRKFAYP